MIDAATRVREVIGDLDVSDIRADTLRRDSILWNFKVLGEAYGQVPAPVKDAYPDVAWMQATRLRNRIVHGYWDVDLQILHQASIDDLPLLIEQLKAVLTELEITEQSSLSGEDT